MSIEDNEYPVVRAADRTIAGHEALHDVLLKRAGLTADLIARGKSDPEFSAILSALEAIHRGKEVLYGNYLETHGASPTALVEHYADVKRKWVRVQNFVAKRLNGEKLDYHELMDTFSDMAVYSIMGIQLLRLLIEKEGK
jgi:hypothetical protein